MKTKAMHMDKLGRVVIPKHIRNTLDLQESDMLMVIHNLKSEEITIKKAPLYACVFCRQEGEIEAELNGKWVCSDCLDKLKPKLLTEESLED